MQKRPDGPVPHTHKVWVQVEVDDGRYCTESPKLIGGIDPDKTKEALISLYRLRPEYGPSELFNDKNQMYTPRRSLEQIIRDDYKRDPNEIATTLRNQSYRKSERRITDERVTEWQGYHPKEEATIVEKYGVSTGREAFFKLSQVRIDKMIERLMTDKPIEIERPGVEAIAKWLEVTPQSLVQATQGDDDAPFFSEAYLYTLIGKELARSVLGRLNTLSVALGVDPWTIDRNVPE